MQKPSTQQCCVIPGMWKVMHHQWPKPNQGFTCRYHLILSLHGQARHCACKRLLFIELVKLAFPFCPCFEVTATAFSTTANLSMPGVLCKYIKTNTCRQKSKTSHLGHEILHSHITLGQKGDWRTMRAAGFHPMLGNNAPDCTQSLLLLVSAAPQPSLTSTA